MKSKDYFSAQSRDYARYRPTYPEELFEYLNSVVPGHHRAWDVGTGSGQAAFRLTPYFEKITATDLSENQIAQAKPHPKIEYRVEATTCPALKSASVDLVTVAQALHWFHFEEFFREVKRVLVPGGIFAAWAYPLHRIDSDVDPLLAHFYGTVVGPYWPPERRLVEEAYQGIPFPFRELKAPSIQFTRQWDLSELMGYLGTWSASQRYREATGSDPREILADPLRAAWGDPARKKAVVWDLILRVGQTETP